MKTVSYLRVSDVKQGRSGLGLEAQRFSVASFLASRNAVHLAEYIEVETATKSKKDNRPELIKALHHAKVTGSTLVIAKLDRLSRNLHFLTSLQEAGTRFIAADMPEANELTVHIMCAVAQAEAKAISLRTKEALQAAKARGQRLGNPNGAAALRRAGKGNTDAVSTIVDNADAYARDLLPVIEDIKAHGITSKTGIARALNERAIMTPRGGLWYDTSVRNLMTRLGLAA